ncbi:MAG: hypothetical protein ACRCSF_13160, partial [Mycobacteriaceae bacterium]
MTTLNEPQILDFRLVPSVLLCWLTTVLGIICGSRVSIVCVVLCCAAAVLTLMIRNRLSWVTLWATTILGTLLVAAGFSIAIYWKMENLEHHPLRPSAGTNSTVTVRVKLSDDPRAIAPGF